MNQPFDPNAKIPSPAEHTFLMSLRLTAEQHRWLENTAACIVNETGHEASHSSILMRLLEFGLPAFEAELEQLRVQQNSGKKRFHTLQLAYSAKS